MKVIMEVNKRVTYSSDRNPGVREAEEEIKRLSLRHRGRPSRQKNGEGGRVDFD